VAISCNHIDIVTALLDAGADVNHIYREQTPLDMLTTNQQNDICAVLRDKGAFTWQQLMVQTSDVSRAVSSDDLELVLSLLENASVKEKETALALAVLNNSLPIVKALLAVGVSASVNFKLTNVLCVASRKGNTDMVRALIDAGADITEKDMQG
jgi:ankyrin repeat protein